MAKIRRYKENELPTPGSVFSMPLADGRFGVVRVVRTKVASDYAFAYVVASDWIGAAPVRPSSKEIRQQLRLTHHKWGDQACGHWVAVPPPASFTPLEPLGFSLWDKVPLQESYASWESFAIQRLLQWRWDHDRVNLLQEDAEKAIRLAEERRIANERRAEMLRTLTLQNVSNRVWFDSWDEELDKSNVQDSRKLIANLIHDLTAAPKLKKTDVRRMLRGTVRQFNALDKQNNFIETTHREDICEALELVLCAARQPDLVAEIDEWREW